MKEIEEMITKKTFKETVSTFHALMTSTRIQLICGGYSKAEAEEKINEWTKEVVDNICSSEEYKVIEDLLDTDLDLDEIMDMILKLT